MDNTHIAAPRGSATAYPGQKLATYACIAAVFLPLVGLIMGAIALKQSHGAGQRNTWALVAIVISLVSWGISIAVFASL